MSPLRVPATVGDHTGSGPDGKWEREPCLGIAALRALAPWISRTCWSSCRSSSPWSSHPEPRGRLRRAGAGERAVAAGAAAGAAAAVAVVAGAAAVARAAAPQIAPTTAGVGSAGLAVRALARPGRAEPRMRTDSAPTSRSPVRPAVSRTSGRLADSSRPRGRLPPTRLTTLRSRQKQRSGLTGGRRAEVSPARSPG